MSAAAQLWLGAPAPSLASTLLKLAAWTRSFVELRVTPRPLDLAQKLASYGRIKSVVFGSFGEASADVHALVGQITSGRALREWIRLGCRDSEDAKATLARYIYRSWGLAAVRAQARLKIDGLAHAGSGAPAAAARRAYGAELHGSLREAYQLHHRGGR